MIPGHINYLSLKEKRAEPAREKGERRDSGRRHERSLFNLCNRRHCALGREKKLPK